MNFYALLPMVMGDNITISHEKVHLGVNGKRYLVVHGDMFDAVTMTKKWVAHLGDRCYLFMLRLNRPINTVRRWFGKYHYCIPLQSGQTKCQTRVSFITDLRRDLSSHADDGGYDGVICGHIHHAEIRTINGIEYLNCGDWVESCSAIAEHYDGDLKSMNTTTVSIVFYKGNGNFRDRLIRVWTKKSLFAYGVWPKRWILPL